MYNVCTSMRDDSGNNICTRKQQRSKTSIKDARVARWIMQTSKNGNEMSAWKIFRVVRGIHLESRKSKNRNVQFHENYTAVIDSGIINE